MRQPIYTAVTIFNTTPEQKEEIIQKAKEERITISELIRRIINQHIKNKRI